MKKEERERERKERERFSLIRINSCHFHVEILCYFFYVDMRFLVCMKEQKNCVGTRASMWYVLIYRVKYNEKIREEEGEREIVK